MSALVLVVDDDETQRNILKKVLLREGYNVELSADAKSALEQFITLRPDIVVTDVRMSGMSGLDLFYEIKKIDENVPVIIITAFGTIESAVQVMADGACYYLTKPLDLKQLKALIKKALGGKITYEREGADDHSTYGFGNMVGQSAKMQEIYSILRKVSSSDLTVLITGETGTGKELAAHAIHDNSPRRNYPFVKVSCASIPETLLESALFGREKGAYTGADTRQIGMFEYADKGSIFLDEIGELNHNVQLKLLRFLQEKKFERVGGIQTISVDVRVIAATNVDLEKAVQESKIRKDLYYRLNVVQVHMPPLRERRDDIPLLVEHFLRKYKDKSGEIIKRISPEALSLLMQHDWPGNVRELENCIERAIVMSKGETIEVSDLPEYIYEGVNEAGSERYSSLEEIERNHIIRALKEAEGVQVKAAKILGISRRQLQGRLKKYGINVEKLDFQKESESSI